MKNKKLLVLGLAAAICCTGCFDKYAAELTADEAKEIVEAIIANSERTDFALPDSIAVSFSVDYVRNNEDGSTTTGSTSGKLEISEPDSYIVMEALEKEQGKADKVAKYYAFTDENNYIVATDNGTEKVANYFAKSSFSREEAFGDTINKVTKQAKELLVEKTVLELFRDSLLSKFFVKGLHYAENIPLGDLEFTCSLTSDGPLNLKTRYYFNLDITITDVIAEWKDGILANADMELQNEDGHTFIDLMPYELEMKDPNLEGYTKNVM